MAEETALPRGDANMSHAQAIDELRSMTWHDVTQDKKQFDRRCQLLNGLGRTKIHYGEDGLRLSFKWNKPSHLRPSITVKLGEGEGGLPRAVALLTDAVIREDADFVAPAAKQAA